jgi:hypothetical protein
MNSKTLENQNKAGVHAESRNEAVTANTSFGAAGKELLPFLANDTIIDTSVFLGSGGTSSKKTATELSASAGPERLFDCTRDELLISSGKFFFCHGHLSAQPVESMSRNPAYCCKCFKVIESEHRKEKDSDSWRGEVFLHHNRRYTVHANIPNNNKSYNVQIRTYQLPSEKIATTLLQPIKVPTASKNTTPTTNIGNATYKKCLICGKVITWGNSRVKYCSDPCQKKAYLMRKAAGEVF